jgi:hypothetical protein
VPGPDRQRFVSTLYPIARAYAAQTGIPAEVFLAIAAHESNFGNAPGNMLFGIKGPGARLQTYEVEGGRDVPQAASFATYGSPQASFQGFVDLVSGGRYAGAWNQLQQTGDWRGFLRGINQAGYATDPRWADKIVSFTTGTIAPLVQTLGPRTAEAAELDVSAPGPGGGAVASNAPAVSPSQRIFDQVMAAKGEPISIVAQDPTIKQTRVDRYDEPQGTEEVPNPSPVYRYTFADKTYLDVKSEGRVPGQSEGTQTVLSSSTALASLAKAEAAGEKAAATGPKVTSVGGKPFVWDEATQSFTPAPGLPVEVPPKPTSTRQLVTRGGKSYIYDPETGAFTPAQGLPDEPAKTTSHTVGGRAFVVDEAGNVVSSVDLRTPQAIAKEDVDLQKTRRDLLPAQQQILQGHLETVEYIRGMLERGEIDQPQADAYVAASKAASQAALRGTTPFDEMKEERTARENRQKMGVDLLNQRLSSGQGLASSLLSSATSLAGHAMLRPGQTSLGVDPLANLFPIVEQLQGGPEVTPFARGLLMGGQQAPPSQQSPLLAGL